MENDLKIREAQPGDAERLLEIYAPYILNTAVSFEYEVPSVDEFRERIIKIKEKYPYLVCEKNGEIAGYVYASAYGVRKAFSWSVSTSIYVDRKFRRMGAGSLLYEHLEEELKKMDVVNLIAAVAYCQREDEHLSKDSYFFHLRQGYEKAGELRDVGKKFGKWYDLLLMQKKLLP